jgi:hypothetical protein
MQKVFGIGWLIVGSFLYTVHAQGLSLSIPETAKTAAGFAPPGWQVEAVEEGDLNGDKIPDAAIVLKRDDYKEPDTDDSYTFTKRLLVLAVRHNGTLTRTAVSDHAVLDSNEGGVLGDPFQEVKIERGAVVITHYGGSRYRWGYTHRYRWQQNQWMLIGTTDTASDIHNPEMKDETDTNLSTGLVVRMYMNVINDATGKKKPTKNGHYYELPAITISASQTLDGVLAATALPGYMLKLDTKKHVVSGAPLWKDATDLSARLQAVRQGEDIFVRVEVTDNQFSDGDAVRLVHATGQVITPKESKVVQTDKGYIFAARYSMQDLAKLAPGSEYHTELLHGFLTASNLDVPAVNFFAAVEVVDVDGTAKRAVLSTKVPGSPYNGSIKAYQKGVAVLENALALPRNN